MIENEQGFRILVDPFNNAPEWSLGLEFPDKFNDKPFGANIVLMSEPDSDHAYAPGGWLQNAPQTQPNSNPFPDLNLRGTTVFEFNGDLNIAWHYTVDGIRLAHFADNAHTLLPDQLEELKTPDIVFMPLPKAEWNEADIDIVRENIKALSPKLVIWSHHIAPEEVQGIEDKELLRIYFVSFFRKHASMSKAYTGEESFIELCYVLENALQVNSEYNGSILHQPSFNITLDELFSTQSTKSLLFLSMVAKPKFE